jgi:predicted HTH domain antitoxin
MKNITIPVEVPSDLLVTLNETEKELKYHFQVAIAIMLFQEGKLTIGKAIQLSGLNRFEFEKALTKNKIPISRLFEDEILSDVEKLKEF